jgi:hypothetical protein
MANRVAVSPAACMQLCTGQDFALELQLAGLIYWLIDFSATVEQLMRAPDQGLLCRFKRVNMP